MKMLKLKNILFRTINKCLPTILLLLIILNCNEIAEGTISAPKTNAEAKSARISKKDVIKLIKEQGTKTSYYLDYLSYQLINVDNDDDLEIIAQTVGGVRLGCFFLFDKKTYGKYSFVAERFWKIEKLNFAEYPNLIGDIKLNELIERSGGSGVDIYTAHLWYLKEGKFIEAWEGTVKERSFFQDNYYLGVGGYQYVNELDNLYTWLSNYSIEIDTNTQIEKPMTTVSIYRFDGNKFILETEEKCEHSKVFPNIQLKK